MLYQMLNGLPSIEHVAVDEHRADARQLVAQAAVRPAQDVVMDPHVDAADAQLDAGVAHVLDHVVADLGIPAVLRGASGGCPGDSTLESPTSMPSKVS